MTTSRRTVLRRAGTALGVGVAGGLAGCPDGGSTFAADSTGPWYEGRIPAADALGTDHVTFRYMSMASVAPRLRALDVGAVWSFEEDFGVAATDVEHSLAVSGWRSEVQAMSWVGDFDPESVLAAIASDREYTEATTTGEYTLYSGGNARSFAAGVESGRIVFSHRRRGDALATVEALVDAERGAAPTLLATDDAARELVDAVGDGPWVAIQRHGPLAYLENSIGEGQSIDPGEDAIERTAAFAFESADGATARPLRQWATRRRADDSQVQASGATEGRVASLTERLAPDAVDDVTLLLPWPSYDYQHPRPEFDFSYRATEDGSDGRLTVTYAEGRPVPRWRLELVGEGFAAVPDVDQTAAGRWAGETSQTLGDEPAVTPGDAVTVGVESDYDVGLRLHLTTDGHTISAGSDTGPAFEAADDSGAEETRRLT